MHFSSSNSMALNTESFLHKLFMYNILILYIRLPFDQLPSDASTQSLDKPFAFELWGLRNETQDVIQEALSTYLAENGWAANLASMGHVYESEVALSFDWLGVTLGTGRFVEIPSVRIGGGLLISKGDPRAEEIKALSREERERRYPRLSWPLESAPRDSIGMGPLPDTIHMDPADYGRIWIDLEG